MKTYLRGVEVPLPDGERVLWQGTPSRTELALHAFHARKIALYFVGLIVLAGVRAYGEANAMDQFRSSAMWLALGGAIATLFAFVVATLSARTTLYAITERRVVMKVGIALPVVLNMPLHVIDGVKIRQRANGMGDIALNLGQRDRVAYAVLWPHARAWRIRHPEPLLRGVTNAMAVGETLTKALIAAMAPAAVASTAVDVSISDRPSIAPAPSFTRPDSAKAASVLAAHGN